MMQGDLKSGTGEPVKTQRDLDEQAALPQGAL